VWKLHDAKLGRDVLAARLGVHHQPRQSLELGAYERRALQPGSRQSAVVADEVGPAGERGAYRGGGRQAPAGQDGLGLAEQGLEDRGVSGSDLLVPIGERLRHGGCGCRVECDQPGSDVVDLLT
jgi:hypothetical protein